MNRYATDHDKFAFEQFLAPNEEEIKDGDLVFDYWSLDKYLKGTTHVVSYTFITSQWPNIREGGTIWLDSDAYKKLGGIQNFRLTNNSDKVNKLWPIEGVRVKAIPNAQLHLNVSPVSHGAFLFNIEGEIKYVEASFGSKQYPGHYTDPLDPRVFTRDKFGIVVDGDGYFSQRHLFYLNAQDGGHVKADGLAVGGGGFSALRALDGKAHRSVSGVFKNCYFYGTGSELVYAGYTGGPPWGQWKRLVMEDVLLVNAGTEAFQLGHLAGECDFNRILIAGSSSRYISPFQRWQEGTIQLSVDSGNNRIRNLIIDGFGAGAITLHSSSGYDLPEGKVSGPAVGDHTIIENFHIENGSGNLLYAHNSASHGMKWTLRNGTVGNFNTEYAERVGEGIPNSFFSGKVGTDQVVIENVTVDKSRAKVLARDSDFPGADVKVVDSVPKIKYHRRGYDQYVKTWFPVTAPFHPNAGTPTTWKKGEVVLDDVEGVGRLWCKCLEDHTASYVRPRNDDSWMVLTWDEYGVCCDDPDWRIHSNQRTYPPDDYRVVGEYSDLWFAAPQSLQEKFAHLSSVIENLKAILQRI